MIKKLALQTKLLVSFLVIGLLPIIIAGIISLNYSRSALEQQAFNQLVSVRDIKSNAVKRYITSIENQILTLSKSTMITNAMTEMSNAFANYRDELGIGDESIGELRRKLSVYYKQDFSREYEAQNSGTTPDVSIILDQLDANTIAFQYSHISGNRHPLGSKHLLDSTADGSTYAQLHARYHPIIRDYLQKFGYYDIFLVEPQDGIIVYSVFKELDYSTSLRHGPYADTGIGQAFQMAVTNKDADSFVFVDYAQYFPSYEAPASFIASPIFKDNKLIGVLIFQMPIDRLNEIMAERTGLGESGETYLVGSDKLMRSDSYLDPENHSVTASFRHPQMGTVDTDASNQALNGEKGAKIITDYNGNPVLSAFASLDVAGKKWAILAEIDGAEAFASIDQLTLLVTIIIFVSAVAIIFFSIFIARSIAFPLREVIKSLANGAAQVSSASEQVASSSQMMAEGASEQASSLEEFGSSLEQMSSMTRQNADNTTKANTISEEAHAAASKGNVAMGRMSEAISKIKSSSDETAKIIKTIDEIAFQTNLLALNAAVEAARAGEAGKGFAVVAEEVRNLAQRSAEAARNTSKLIGDSQINSDNGVKATQEVADILDNVVSRVEQVSQLINNVSAASDEQTRGIDQITNSISQMDRITQSNAANTEETASSSEELSSQANELFSLVNTLRNVVEGSGSNNHNMKRSQLHGTNRQGGRLLDSSSV